MGDPSVRAVVGKCLRYSVRMGETGALCGVWASEERWFRFHVGRVVEDVVGGWKDSYVV